MTSLVITVLVPSPLPLPPFCLGSGVQVLRTASGLHVFARVPCHCGAKALRTSTEHVDLALISSSVPCKCIGCAGSPLELVGVYGETRVQG